MNEKVLVLGSASWLGFLLIEKLRKLIIKPQIAGTFNNQIVSYPPEIKQYKADNLHDFNKVFHDFEPTVIVNFLRGEDEEGMMIHKLANNFIRQVNGYYIYASSALALDNYKDVPLTENILANAKSEYGLFKANAEQHLYDSNSNWCILRFSSLQGWVPHKKTRNQIFLEKISAGEPVIVDCGVFQNRMFADLMIEGVVELVKVRHNGIVHFGTIDSSDEVDFLRKQAVVFGFPEKVVKEGLNTRNVNLVCIPGVIKDILDKKFIVSENDTLKRLFEIEKLKQITYNEF